MSGTDFYYEPQVRLGEELSAIAPMPGPHRSFFGNSGTEANEAALKLAKYYTKRHNIIAFLGAFHGRTMGSLSLTASKLTQRRGFAPFVPGRVSRAVSRTAIAVRSDATPETCAAECLRFIEEQLFVHLVSPDEVAAIMVEPIQGEGGYIVPPDVFPAAAARDDDAARHAADRRRSAVGHGPHRADVRDRAHRRRARRRDDGEGDRVGAAAGRRRRRARR